MKYGVRAKQSDLVVHLLRERATDDGPRVGLVVSKKVGSAVERHQVSRRIRHVAKTILGDLQSSDRVVIRALPGSRSSSSLLLSYQLNKALRRAFELAGTH